MGFQARDRCLEMQDAFMAGDNAHAGRFTDDDCADFRQLVFDALDHAGRAKAADFFIIREREVNRTL